jgi:hypothetical protein
MRHTKTREFQAPPKKQWEFPSYHAKASVRALVGVALGGSIATALLILSRFIIEPARIDTIGILLFAVLILNACWMSKIIHQIGPSRRRRRDRSSQPTDDNTTVPPKVERDMRRGLKRCSAVELARLAASGDLEDWYLRIVRAELRRRNGRRKGLVIAGAAVLAILAIANVRILSPSSPAAERSAQ